MFSDEIDGLLVELAASLAPPQRAAFEAAARAALADIPCLGPGVAFRTLAELQKKGFWDPPPDARRANLGARHHRDSRLKSLPAVGVDDPRSGGRDRRRLRLV